MSETEKPKRKIGRPVEFPVDLVARMCLSIAHAWCNTYPQSVERLLERNARFFKRLPANSMITYGKGVRNFLRDMRDNPHPEQMKNPLYGYYRLALTGLVLPLEDSVPREFNQTEIRITKTGLGP